MGFFQDLKEDLSQAVNELFTDFAIDENGGSIFIATDKGNVIVYDLDVFDFRL